MLPACFDIVAMVTILYPVTSGQNKGHFYITSDDHGTTTWFLIQQQPDGGTGLGPGEGASPRLRPDHPRTGLFRIGGRRDGRDCVDHRRGADSPAARVAGVAVARALRQPHGMAAEKPGAGRLPRPDGRGGHRVAGAVVSALWVRRAGGCGERFGLARHGARPGGANGPVGGTDAPRILGGGGRLLLRRAGLGAQRLSPARRPGGPPRVPVEKRGVLRRQRRLLDPDQPPHENAGPRAAASLSRPELCPRHRQAEPLRVPRARGLAAGSGRI